MSRILVVNVKRKWFEQIKAGIKTEEYRLMADYWSKRLVSRTYDKIIIKLGYPKRDDMSRQLEFPWRGFTVKAIEHEEWNYERKTVYAIKLAGGE